MEGEDGEFYINGFTKDYKKNVERLDKESISNLIINLKLVNKEIEKHRDILKEKEIKLILRDINNYLSLFITKNQN